MSQRDQRLLHGGCIQKLFVLGFGICVLALVIKDACSHQLPAQSRRGVAKLLLQLAGRLQDRFGALCRRLKARDLITLVRVLVGLFEQLCIGDT